MFNRSYQDINYVSLFSILLNIQQLIEIISKNKEFEHNNIGNINSVLKMIVEKDSERYSVINPIIFIDNFKNQHLEYSGYSQKDTEIF